MECAELLDWPAKLRLLEGFRNRENLGWSAPRLQLVDLQYSDVRLDKGLYNRLVARGSMKRLAARVFSNQGKKSCWSRVMCQISVA